MNFQFNNTHVQPKGKPIVYWIHKPTHTDMYADGYIGITKNTARQRWMEHLALARNNRKNNRLYEVLKEQDDLIFDVIVVGESREYCERIEHGLRPIPNIGWNTAPGGRDGYTQIGGQINKERWKAKGHDKAVKAWWQAEMVLLRALHKKAKDLEKAKALAEHRAKFEPMKNHGKRKMDVRNKSGYTGVGWYEKYQMWRSQICIDKRYIVLGYFKTTSEAYQAYLIAKAHVPLIRSSEMDVKGLRAIIRKPTGKN